MRIQILFLLLPLLIATALGLDRRPKWQNFGEVQKRELERILVDQYKLNSEDKDIVLTHLFPENA